MSLPSFILLLHIKVKSFEKYQERMVLIGFELCDSIDFCCAGHKNRYYCFDSEKSHFKETVQKVMISGSHRCLISSMILFSFKDMVPSFSIAVVKYHDKDNS